MSHSFQGRAGRSRYPRVVTLALLAALVLGCDHDDAMPDEDEENGPAAQSEFVELKYDSFNNDAPNLQGATFEAAARFTAAQTASLAGGMLMQVTFYIVAPPALCRVKVYGGGTATSPGALLYAGDVTASISANEWNLHYLQTPLAVPNGDLWIGIEFTPATQQRTIGCDPGPALPDGDWLRSSADGMWKRFSERFPGESVNWNVRGVVEIAR
jgi:hypothetical protein